MKSSVDKVFFFLLLSGLLSGLWPSLAVSGIDTCNSESLPHYVFTPTDQQQVCPQCALVKPEVNAERADKWNRATLTLFDKVSKHQPHGNHVVSSHSIFETLSMLGAGAEGKTQKQIFEHIGATSDDIGTTSDTWLAFQKMMDVQTEGKDEKFSRSNVVMVAKRHELKEIYRKFIGQFGKCDVEKLDISDKKKVDELVNSVNNRVCSMTEGMIETCVSSDDLSASDPALFLINVTYFQDKWGVEFERQDEKGTFKLSNESTVDTTMINARDGRIGYVEYEGWQSVSIPYKGSFEMVAMLPSETGKGNFQDLFSSLDGPETKDGIIVDLTMPEYTIDMEYELIDLLKTDQPGDMFSPSADFGGMVEDASGLYVMAARHKAKIETDVEGTKAVGVTEVCVADCMLEVKAPTVVKVNLNRPFLFLIRDKKNKAIRFIGKLADPRVTADSV